MILFSWMWRIGAAFLAVSLAARIVDFAHVTFIDARPASSQQTSAVFWDIWFVSWIAASVWSRPATAQPALGEQVAHWTPTIVGFILLSYGSAAPNPITFLNAPLWRMSPTAGWALAGVCAIGLLFTWWARVSLGALWSGSVSRKDSHTIIRSGAYQLVRHPIYTGLIVAAFAYATQIAMPANLIGAALMSAGFWMKARLEERFLSQELGAEAYDDYRRGTPMLIPFWPSRG